MCNRFKQYETWPELPGLRTQILWPEAVLRNAPPDDVRPTDPALVLRWDEGKAVAGRLRWGFPPPPGRKGGPVINYVSEDRRFGPKRCLIPAELFYEFTGTSYPKTKWTVRLADGGWMCMAGIWREGQGDVPASFSILTTAPGPDIAPIHDREMVTIAPDAWERWLMAGDDARDLLRHRPAGTFRIDRAPPDEPTPKRKGRPKHDPPGGLLL